jgi:pimeloyl-ACP methyl ester carboxylesterase
MAEPTLTKLRMPRIAALVAALAIPTLLSGCFFVDAEPVESVPTGESVDAGLERYYSQVLRWVDCDNGAECATAIAPLDWSNPSSDTDIELALARHTASGTKLGSLFVNPGGPGASGYDFIHDDVDFAASAELQERFDVVGWDPRGVGRSSAVTCYDGEQLDDFIFGIPDAEIGSPEWIDASTQGSIDFGQACLENTGELLQFVDTQSTVHDLDMLRAVVGDEKLNYLGYSYGSDIGSYYIERFPDRVGRIVVDGATDSSIPLFEVGLTQTKGFQRALENYLAVCQEQFDDCPFSGDLTDDLSTIRGLYDALDASPIPGADGRLMDAGVLDIAMSTALYSEESWPLINDLYNEVLVGDSETAFFLADFYYSRDVDGTYADNSLEAFIAIYCVDYPVETDPVVLAEQSKLIEAASPATYRNLPPIGDQTCINWPYGYTGASIGALTGAGAPPVLIISTTGDPATPYEWGVALADQMESGVLVTFNGEGHTAYTQRDPCIVEVVDRYFVDGVVPSADPNCAA